MAENAVKITVEEIKKMLTKSILSDELKTAYLALLADMTEEEKAELVRIVEEGNEAKKEYEEERLEKLARLNAALEKHLKNSLREEEKYAREQFEAFEETEDKAEMKELEKEINDL